MLGEAVDVLGPHDNNPIVLERNRLLHAGTPATIKEVMLTTSDNPFDPFTEFELWYRFDSSMNYYSCNYLARIAKTSDELTDADNALAIEAAVDEIVQLNLMGNYVKVQRFVTA